MAREGEITIGVDFGASADVTAVIMQDGVIVDPPVPEHKSWIDLLQPFPTLEES